MILIFYWPDYTPLMHLGCPRLPGNIEWQSRLGNNVIQPTWAGRQNYRYKLQGMFRELAKWCQRDVIVCGQEQRYEVEVSPFFQVQEQLNHLPSFESQYVDRHSLLPPYQHPWPARAPLNGPGFSLKRVKSQPDYQLEVSHLNGKENSTHLSPHNYRKGLTTSVHQSDKRPPIRILYEKSDNTSQSRSQWNRPKINPKSQQSLQSSLSRQGRGLAEIGGWQPSEERSSVVPLEEFNRVVNINLELIKLIEEDYQPMRATVSQLEQEHEQRRRLVDALERKLRRMRGEMAGAR